MVDPASERVNESLSPPERLFAGSAELWDRLRADILPVAARRIEARLWSAGPGAGEDAYSLAVLWRESAATASRAVRILATDARPERIERAGAGVYSRAALGDVPPEAAARCFLAAGGEDRVVAAEVRALVHFAALDLTRDPWPREIDLLLLADAGGDSIARAALSLQSHAWLALRPSGPLPEGGETLFDQVAADLPLYRKRK